MTDRFLRRGEVESLAGISKATIYRQIKAKAFPRPVPIEGVRAVRWRESDVVEWQQRQLERAAPA